MNDYMSLHGLYADLLRKRDRRCAGALADALRSSRPTEALLLDRFGREGTTFTVDYGSWRGHTAWIGPKLPKTQEPGQLWLDTVEIAAMVSVPSEPVGTDWHPEAIERWTPLLGWLSLHPVAVWQYHAYLQVASPSTVAAAAQRIFRDVDETAAVTHVSGSEAQAFAHWAGKWLSWQGIWQAVYERMGEDTFGRLWGTSSKEWCSYDSDFIALSRQTLYTDHKDEPDESRPPELRMEYEPNEWSPDIGFRTAIHHQHGLDHRR